MSLIWIVNILSVFFLCVFFAGIVIPQILLIAFRRRLFDEPDERKIHQCVVPRLGGMAFKPVVFFSFVLLLAVNVSTGHDELLKEWLYYGKIKDYLLYYSLEHYICLFICP